MGVALVPSAGIADHALAIALEYRRTVYDALYLANALNDQTLRLAPESRAHR